MAINKSKTIDPWKLKRWYPIYGPKYLRGAFIGETPATESKNVVGREVNISLAAVLNDMKKQNINVTFKITKLEGSNAITEVKKFEISPSYVRRQIRKDRDRVDDSIVLKTADKKDVVLKPFLVTKNPVNNSKKTLLRKMARQELKDYVSKVTYSELVQDLISTKIQKTLGNVLRKVCPLRSADIRVMEIVQKSELENIESPAENAEQPVEKIEENAVEQKPEEKPKKPKKEKSEESGEEVKEEKPKKKPKKAEEVKAE